MNDYLIDRETLGQFVDALIAQKYQTKPAEIGEIKERALQDLNDKILDAILKSLSREKFDELNALLDDESADEATFENFFKNSGLNVEEKLTETLNNFKLEFLGGNNV